MDYVDSGLEYWTKEAYRRHRDECTSGDWMHGEPIKSWYHQLMVVAIRYEDGTVFTYKDLDLPFPTIQAID